MLNNGLGRHTEALTAGQRASENHFEIGFSNRALAELVEAAARSGMTETAADAFRRLAEMTTASATDWALGIQARSRALLSEAEEGEGHYREAIARLGRTRVRTELARAHLLYGEWLRRQRRRIDARQQLRTAYDMLDAMGVEAFAARARRELQAAGQAPARKSPVAITLELTSQEPQVARLAPRGLLEPGDRYPAVSQPAHGPVPPGQGLHQARHQLAQPAPPPAKRPGCHLAALTASRS